jgi:hypothetical protein
MKFGVSTYHTSHVNYIEINSILRVLKCVLTHRSLQFILIYFHMTCVLGGSTEFHNLYNIFSSNYSNIYLMLYIYIYIHTGTQYLIRNP